MRNKAGEIRARLRDGRSLVMPGVYDVLSARLAARAGFEIIFISAIVYPHACGAGGARCTTTGSRS